MRIIDKRGRLFGKLNLFDLFILSIFVIIIGLGTSKYNNRLEVNSIPTEEITFKLFINHVRNVTTDAIHIGDKLREYETNEIMGEIIEKEIMPSIRHVNTEDGKIIGAEVPERYDVILTVKGEGTVTDMEITLGSKIIKLGTPIKVRTNKYEVSTMVFGIDYKE